MMRRLVVADLDALADVEHRAQRAWTKEQLDEELRHDAADVFGVFDDSVLAGYVAVRVIADDAWVMNIAVDPRRRRRGYGAQLLAAAADAARARGCAVLWLEVRAGNAAALNLYRAVGFVAAGLRRGYYPALHDASEREDALLMTLSLRAA